jgi:hypothetical protein
VQSAFGYTLDRELSQTADFLCACFPTSDGYLIDPEKICKLLLAKAVEVPNSFQFGRPHHTDHGSCPDNTLLSGDDGVKWRTELRRTSQLTDL